MNTIASSMGIRGKPGEILDHVVTRYHAGLPLAQASRWSLCVNGHHYGFLFGTGIQAAFLEAYYEGSEPTPLKAAWVLTRAALSALVGGSFIKRLAAYREQEVIVDGLSWGHRRYLTVGAGTVDDIGLGFRPYYLAPRHPERLHLVGFSCSPVTVALSLLRMWRARALGSPDIVDAVCADVRIHDDEPIAFMIDGDFHREGLELTLSIGPRVDFIVPDL